MTKYYTRVSRYVEGVYYQADAEHPALVDIPDNFKVSPDDRTLVKADQESPPPVAAPVKPPFAKPDKRKKDRAGPPPPHGRQPGETTEPARPSDTDPATQGDVDGND